MTDPDDDQQQDEDPFLDGDTDRLGFWLVFAIGVFLAVVAVAVQGLTSFGLGTLVAFWCAFAILVRTGHFDNWKPAHRISFVAFIGAGILALIAYGRARGWF